MPAYCYSVNVRETGMCRNVRAGNQGLSSGSGKSSRSMRGLPNKKKILSALFLEVFHDWHCAEGTAHFSSADIRRCRKPSTLSSLFSAHVCIIWASLLQIVTENIPFCLCKKLKLPLKSRGAMNDGDLHLDRIKAQL